MTQKVAYKAVRCVARSCMFPHFFATLALSVFSPFPPFVGGGITISHTDGGRRKGKKESRSRYKFNIAPSSFCCHLTRRHCETELGRQKRNRENKKYLKEFSQFPIWKGTRPHLTPLSPKRKDIGFKFVTGPWQVINNFPLLRAKKKDSIEFSSNSSLLFMAGSGYFFCMRDRCVWFFSFCRGNNERKDFLFSLS